MRMLVLSPLLYHPTCGNGGGVICFTLLAALARRHEVEFVGFGDPGDTQALQALGSVCRAVHVVPMPQVDALRRLWRRAGQWRGGMPAEALAFDSAAMRARLHEVVARFDPELVILQFPYMAQYAAYTGDVPTVMDVQDMCFVSRLRTYIAQSGRWARVKKMVSWLAWTRYEWRWYSRCQLLMALSDGDRSALNALVPQVRAFTNPAAITLRQQPAALVGTGLRLGFGGHFAHPPNLDALLWLSDAIVPQLVEKVPDVEIVVAGRGIPDAVAARLHRSICLLGFVDDYDAFLASLSVFIAPLRIGGGVKVKVLEALACGRPVVTTAIGAEGISLSESEGLYVRATAATLAEQVAALMLRPDPGAALRGAVRVAAEFGVAAAVDRFEREAARLLSLCEPSHTLHRCFPGYGTGSERAVPEGADIETSDA